MGFKEYSVAIVIKALDKASGPLKQLGSHLNQLKASGHLKSMANATDKFKSSLSNAGKETGAFAARLTAMAAVGGYAFKKLFVDTAVEFENYRTILETVEGSSKKAEKALSWVSNFAATTPYEIGEVTEAFVRLRAYGMEPTKGLLRSLGDTSAAMGKPLMQSVEAIADAITGENERLKEFGIKARKGGGMIAYEYTDKNGKTVVKKVKANNRELIQATLMGIWNNKYAGAMEKQSKTFAGMLSNISDAFTRFELMVMGSGLFDMMKDEVSGVLDSLNQMANDGSMKKLAQSVGTELKAMFVELKQAAIEVWPVLKQIGGTIAALAKNLGGYGNLLKVIVAAMAIPVVVSYIQSIVAGVGLINAGLGLMGLNWGMIGTAVVTFGRLLLTALAPFAPALITITAIGIAGTILYNKWTPFKQLVDRIVSNLKEVPALLNYATGGGRATVMDTSKLNPAARKRYDAIMAQKGGKRAIGGPVRAGLAYTVGEFGQETFIPNQSGRILNQRQMGGRDELHITLTIDSKGMPQVANVESRTARKVVVSTNKAARGPMMAPGY